METRISQFLMNIPIISLLYKKILYQKHLFYFSKDPKILANRSYKRVFNRNINWKKPSDLIEKIIWMQFNADTTLWTQLADKYAAREYVKILGYEHLLSQLYGKYSSPNGIDFNNLPDRFVIKSNNACGTVMLVDDKYKLNLNKTKKVIKQWLNYRYGVMNAQLHYLKIPPCIIIEEYLGRNNTNGDSLIDYKFTCFDGIPESILVVSSRNQKGHPYKLNLYDVKWNPITYNLCQHINDKTVPRPESLDMLISVCKTLGKNIPYVRIDFYEVDGKPYFGEFTFTTGFGYFTDEYYKYLGSKLII